MKWFTLGYWKYLLEKKDADYSWIQVLKCRITEHKHYDVPFYTSTGVEPNMHCRGCGDDLG